MKKEIENFEIYFQQIDVLFEKVNFILNNNIFRLEIIKWYKPV